VDERLVRADGEAAAFKLQFTSDGHVGDTEAPSRLSGFITAIDDDVVALVEAPAALPSWRCSSTATRPPTAWRPTVPARRRRHQPEAGLLFKPDAAAFTLTPSAELAGAVGPVGARKSVVGAELQARQRHCQAEMIGI
jgi:hypothetical protein